MVPYNGAWAPAAPVLVDWAKRGTFVVQPAPVAQVDGCEGAPPAPDLGGGAGAGHKMIVQLHLSVGDAQKKLEAANKNANAASKD